ncbi:hypothetical protein [Campylobacter jejuni]|uniref:hypothetical protein n=1 Tax=Campylobacter jejuni TaxID=197 RepID=UPI0020447E36|nr:hypothetical protein [Campylobacter jejuni]
MADLEQVASDLNSASQSLQELREKYDGALDLLDNKNTEITAALESAKSNALQEVQTASNTATSQISQLKDTSLNAVNEAKNTAIEEVNNAVSGIDTSKEEALLAIEQAKAAQEEKITDLEQAKENIITELSEKAKILTQNLEWIVGAGGKYINLQDALKEASKLKSIYVASGVKLVIKLKSGFNWDFLLNVKDVDLSFVELQSEDEILNIDSGVINTGNKTLINFENCSPFSINTSFKLLSEVTDSILFKYNFVDKANIAPNKIFEGFDIGINATQSAMIYSPLTTFKNIKKYGINIVGAYAIMAGSIFDGCKNAIYNTGGSTTYLYRGEIKNSTERAVKCINGFVGFFQSSISQDSGTHCEVLGGGTIALTKTTPTGGADYSQPINIATGNGMIYKGG